MAIATRETTDTSSFPLPTPADTLLMIEISDSSLAFDRIGESPLYARAGIPEAWIFDLASTKIERRSNPAPDGYQSIEIASQGRSPGSLGVPGLTIAVDDVI